jgi:hypothetical protein
MQGLLKQPGYRLYSPDTPRPGSCSPTRASAQPTSTGRSPSAGARIRTIVGIKEDGVFGISRGGWRRDLPDACHEPFIALLWLKIHELLGGVPEGSTARFIRDGTLPADARRSATMCQLTS